MTQDLSDYFSKGGNGNGNGNGGPNYDGGGHAACDSPNEPWWCGLYDEEPPKANIDSVGIQIGLAIIITIFVIVTRKLLKNNNNG